MTLCCPIRYDVTVTLFKGCIMPDLRLSEEHARAIAEYLRAAAMVGSTHAAALSAAFDAAMAEAAAPVTCAHCGQPFDAGPGSRARYCSPRCKQAAYRARRMEARRQWRPGTR